MALIANVSGTTSTSSIAPVISATASPRRRTRRCTASSTGHVATTIIAAHTVDSRNGRRIQNDAAISIAINATASTVRVRSRDAEAFGMFM